MSGEKLIEKVRDLLANRPSTMSLKDIESKTDVTVAWQTKFLGNKIPNPGTKQIVTLYNLLAPKELKF